MRTVRDIKIFQNIPIVVRTAMNVPLDHGEVANIFRLKRALPTIQFLAERGARVVLVSHIGEAGTETLAPVARALGRLLPNVTFFGETIGPRVRDQIRNLLPGHILVLENLRRNKGEVGNDPAFAKELAALGDIFVQDSFDTCHRSHASIVGVPKLLPSYAGFVVAEEVRQLKQALIPTRPSLAVISGAKFSTKEAVLTKLLATYDRVFVGGALANDFLKAAGHEVGKSLVSSTVSDEIHQLLGNHKLVLPVDVVVATTGDLLAPHRDSEKRVVTIDQIRKDEVILDAGTRTRLFLDALTDDARTILWNGPLGKYEDGFVAATDDFAQVLARHKARSIVGGGDTIASIEKLRLLSQFSFVSTGGGAMLDFLAAGTLVGIEALG